MRASVLPLPRFSATARRSNAWGAACSAAHPEKGCRGLAASPAFRAEPRCGRSDRRPIRNGNKESEYRRGAPSTERSARRIIRRDRRSDEGQPAAVLQIYIWPQRCSETFCARIRPPAAWHKEAACPGCAYKSAGADRRRSEEHTYEVE